MRLAPFVLAAVMAVPAAADPVVVELFTSQGCSACPPADAIAGELTGRDDVIMLSLHVDYWDWIGWADTFGSPAFSQRQRDYASAAGSSVVYTPQFVVGGHDPVAGPAALQLAELIEAHQGATGDVLRVAETAGGLILHAAPAAAPGRLLLLTVLPEATVRILHGENAGHDMVYHNTVTDIRSLGDWSTTDAAEIAMPVASVGHAQVVLAQAMVDGKPERILGSVWID